MMSVKVLQRLTDPPPVYSYYATMVMVTLSENLERNTLASLMDPISGPFVS